MEDPIVQDNFNGFDADADFIEDQHLSTPGEAPVVDDQCVSEQKSEEPCLKDIPHDVSDEGIESSPVSPLDHNEVEIQEQQQEGDLLVDFGSGTVAAQLNEQGNTTEESSVGGEESREGGVSGNLLDFNDEPATKEELVTSNDPSSPTEHMEEGDEPKVVRYFGDFGEQDIEQEQQERAEESEEQGGESEQQQVVQQEQEGIKEEELHEEQMLEQEIDEEPIHEQHEQENEQEYEQEQHEHEPQHKEEATVEPCPPCPLPVAAAVQDNSKTIKIQELMGRIEELETTLKNKDDTITNLQGEVERLNTEIKSKSVPSRKPNAGAGAVDNKARTGPAARKPAQPKPAPTKPNGVAAKKSTMTGASPARKPAAGGAGRPKTAPAKTPASRPGTAKKAGKGPRAERGAEGEEHAVKLFLRGRGVVCYPPTDFTLDSVDASKPDQKLKIDWVYGYRGRDAQDNIYCLPSNELLYYQAAVGVIYNPETKTQRFYQGHNDDIRCIALNPADPNIVATGQAAGHDEKEGQPHVRVWNCETLETLSVFGAGVFQRGVGSVSFSPDGKYVMAVDEGNDHTIYIYEWSKKHKVASQKGHGDPVLGAEYLPSSNSRFVTYGKGHILFWELEGGKLVKKSGLFEKNAKPRFVTSLAFTASGEPVTGDSNGNLFKWSLNDRKIIKAINGAHQGTIYSLAIKDNDIYTGGQDCKVKRFSDTDMTEQDCWALDGDKHGRVKAITFVGEKLAVGTYNNGILFGLFGDEPEQILYGHGAGDLWGGADHPLENSFATVGQDKVVYIWDATTHTPKHVFSVEKPGQACAFSPCGSVLAVATTTGEWYVLDATTGDKLSSYVSGDEQIDAIAFSPDGKQIAVGSHDNFVYLFDSSNLKGEYSQTGKCTGHSSFITHLDFSEDGKIIQTTSGDYEHLYWEAETGEQITSSKDQRDTNMASYTCILGFPVCGIWPIGYDGTDINSLCRSKDGKLLVTADDFGLVNLFRYPCCNPNAEWSSFRGHSAHVTKVRFLKDDTSVISLGGRDQSIIQWAIE